LYLQIKKLFMEREIILKEIKGGCKDHKGKLEISCHKLMAIADKLNIKYFEIGEICNEEKIKVKNCQLG